MALLRRLLTIAILVGGGYWYWSGPYRERTHPSYSEKLRHNAEAMQECMERKTYAATHTLTSAGDVEKICARQLNFYFENGYWYSYDEVRPD